MLSSRNKAGAKGPELTSPVVQSLNPESGSSGTWFYSVDKTAAERADRQANRQTRRQSDSQENKLDPERKFQKETMAKEVPATQFRRGEKKKERPAKEAAKRQEMPLAG